MKVDIQGSPCIKCTYCDKTFKYASERNRHEQSHTPQFQCPVCKKIFGFLSALRRHQQVHIRTEAVKCKKCSRRFKDETLLQRHMKYAHKGSYTCSKCSTTFSSELALRTHKKIHKSVSERRFKCSYENCLKSFNFSHHLKHHELTHQNIKQHYCNVCGKGFIQNHHLKTHMITHEPEKWLPCSVKGCTKKFINHYARKRHLLAHNNLKSISNVDVGRLASQNDDIICEACGQIMLRLHYAEHSLNCNNNKLEAEVHLYKNCTKNNYSSNIVTKNSSVINEESISKCDTFNSVPDKTLQIKHDNLLNDANAVIQPDLVQYTSLSPVNGSKDNYNNTDNNHRSANEDKKNVPCEGCDCVLNLSLKNTQNVIKNDTKTIICNNMPEIEYRIDGTIKLKEFFDDTIAISDKLSHIKSEIAVKKTVINNLALFNSCQAVLGKCIVSDDGTVSAGCLCAKMIIEDQANEQEIDEITPCPTNI